VLRSRRILLEGDRQVRLSSRAFDVLLALIDRAGEVVDKRDLIAAIAVVNASRDSKDQAFSSADLVRNSPFKGMADTALAMAEHIERTGRHALNARERLITGRGDGSVDKIERGGIEAGLFGDEPEEAA